MQNKRENSDRGTVRLVIELFTLEHQALCRNFQKPNIHTIISDLQIIN